MNDIQLASTTNNTDDLVSILDTRELLRQKTCLKADCQHLWAQGRKDTALSVYRRFRRVLRELHRRNNPAIAHLQN